MIFDSYNNLYDHGFLDRTLSVKIVYFQQGSYTLSDDCSKIVYFSWS